MQKKWSYGLLAGFVLICLFVSGTVIQRRYEFEKTRRQVELVASYSELQKLALLGGISFNGFLKQLQAESPLTSIAIEEDDLQTFVDAGKVTVMKGAEILNLYRVGHVNRFLLTRLFNVIKVQPQNHYIIVEENDDFDRITTFLSAELGTKSVRKVGRYNILEVVNDAEDLFEIGLGISESKIRKVRRFGFGVIPRLRNSKRLDAEIIKLKLSTFSKADKVSTLVFEGDSVLGYPAHLDEVSSFLEGNQFNLGVVEFAKQAGDRRLALMSPKDVVRVHSIPETEMKVIDRQVALERYVRASKERGVQMLVLHPFFERFAAGSIVAQNVQFFREVAKGLEKFDFTVQTVGYKGDVTYQSATKWEQFILGAGILVGFMLLLAHFVPVRPTAIAVLVVIYLVGFYWSLVADNLFSWNRFVAIVGTASFPALALIWGFPKLDQLQGKFGMWKRIFVFFRILAVTALGVCLVVALLSDIRYLVSLKHFFGVKITFLIPLFLVGVYFFLRPQRIQSILYVFKRLFYAPIRTSVLVAVLVCLFVALVYILRSGNYFVLQIPVLELKVRQLLEMVLFVRPRTKEFLIGFPFLMMTLLYVDTRISRNWLWFFNILGAVALTSVVNSFCHFHTPLLVSAYRTFMGIVVGFGVFVAYFLIYRFWRIVIRRFI